MANKPKKELNGRQLSTGAKVVIVVFAVMMALSMMLPSLAQVFAGSNNSSSSSEATEQSDTSSSANDEQTTDEAKDDAAADSDKEKADDGTANVPDNETLKTLAEQNADAVKTYTDRLKSDPNNLAAILNLGQTYMNWGYSALYSSSKDEETEYSKGLITKAISYFDQYLKLNDSNAVKVDRALCQYYAGDTDKAVSALEKMTKDNPDYPLGWANLGMLYESQYQNDKASEAYRKAVETDANDEYGAKSYANRRLISINSTVSSPGDAGEASLDSVSTETNSGLTSTLANDSGVGF